MNQSNKTSNEEEYFAKQEIEKKRLYALKVKDNMEAREIDELKSKHFMHCPKCGFELHTVLFKGINIDKCGHCEGVWLDKGELEELAGEEGGIINSFLNILKPK